MCISKASPLHVIHTVVLFKLPQISPASTAESLSNKEEFEFFYRTVPPNSGQLQEMYNLVKLFNWTDVSIINSADVYGESGFKGLQKVFEEDNSSNICIANSIPLQGRSTKIITGQAIDHVTQTRGGWGHAPPPPPQEKF